MQDITHLIVLGICLGAVLQDLISRKVANQSILLGGGLVVLSLMFIQGWAGLSAGLLSALAVFSVGFLLWRFGVLGAGDVKLMSVAALVLPWQRGLEFVFHSFVWGAVLGALALLLDKNLLREAKILKFHPIMTIRSLRVRNHKVPFTVAILLGLIATWLLDSKGVHFL